MKKPGDPGRVEKQSYRLVFDGFMKIYEAVFRHETYAGPMSGPVKRLVLERGDASAAVLWDRRVEKLILTEQFRYPTHEKGPGWLIEIIAGMIDPGETAEAAIRREVEEETGYIADIVRPISHFYTSPGGMTERIHLFYVEANTPSTPRDGLDDEDIRTIRLSKAEVRAALDADQIQDAKSIIGLEWFLKHNP